ncbi:MAG: hypothetical protein ACO1OX_07810 [Novosphingobium sp.]
MKFGLTPAQAAAVAAVLIFTSIGALLLAWALRKWNAHRNHRKAIKAGLEAIRLS